MLHDSISSDDDCSQEKLTRTIDKMMKRHFIGRHYAKVNFWDIDIAWTPQVLQLIGTHPKQWIPLHKMVNHLEQGSRFAFWKMLFENRRHIPQEELRDIWYDCLNDRGCLSYQKVITPNGFEEYNANIRNPLQLADSIITDPILIDNPIVSYRYSQAKKPGWRKIQYIHGRRHQTLRIPDSMRQAIQEDNLPVFAMGLDILGKEVSFSLLAEVLEANAVGIFHHLLENRMLQPSVISLPELCCYLTAGFRDSISIPLLSAMDDVYPGLLKDVRDDFGRNLLWYAVQNMKTGWFHPNCRLTPFLLEHGCDPRNETVIGLTWQSVRDGLPLELRAQMMRRRYNMGQSKTAPPSILQQDQPLENLTDAAAE